MHSAGLEPAASACCMGSADFTPKPRMLEKCFKMKLLLILVYDSPNIFPFFIGDNMPRNARSVCISGVKGITYCDARAKENTPPSKVQIVRM